MHYPSVSWHIIPPKFSSWNIICFGQKEPIKVQFFRFLSALMKVHPILHAIFETTTRSRFIQISHHCSVSWKITPLYFFTSNLICFGQKEPVEVKFSDLSGRVKIHEISHAIFETKSQFFFKLCVTLHCHEK